jgi:hypothetical protein
MKTKKANKVPRYPKLKSPDSEATKQFAKRFKEILYSKNSVIK